MEDELRLSLLVAGTFFILAVLAHGIWKIRKGSKSNDSHQPRVEPGEWSSDEDDALDADDIAWNDDDVARQKSRPDQHAFTASEPDYDDLGLGQVRVVAGSASGSQPEPPTGAEGASKESTEQDATAHDDVEEELLQTNPVSASPASGGEQVEEDPEPVNRGQHTSRPEAAEKLYGSVVTNPKPHMQSTRTNVDSETDIPEPPGFLLREQEEASEAEAKPGQSDANSAIESEVDDFSLDAQPSQTEEPEAPSNVSSFSEQARRLVGRKKARPQTKKRQEPRFGDDQMRIDFEEEQAQNVAASDNDKGSGATEQQSTKSEAPAGEQEVLVLNVRAPEDEPISGAALLPMLLTLGFKFGDQDIFHRHVNSNGKGPVLFSLANMFKPGVFDIDNLENFTTQGVSLFMILPIEGDPHQVFNMMHNAARKIADEFHAQVLDGRRSVLTKQGLQQYIEKIREFERQRMISRH